MKCIPYTRITMASLLLVSANTDVKVYHPSRLFTKISDCSTPRIRGFSFAPAFNFPVVYPQKSLRRSFSPLNVNSSGDEATGDLIEELRVPIQWSEPSKALEKSDMELLTVMEAKLALNQKLDARGVQLAEITASLAALTALMKTFMPPTAEGHSSTAASLDSASASACELEEIAEPEKDAALGSCGSGRLASCFLDSMATLDSPAWGYGLRYKYGLHKQHITEAGQRKLLKVGLRNSVPGKLQDGPETLTAEVDD